MTNSFLSNMSKRNASSKGTSNLKLGSRQASVSSFGEITDEDMKAVLNKKVR